MASSSGLPPPQVARTIYRCLLRASRFGQSPEVFGPFGATAAASFAANENIPLKGSSTLASSCGWYPSSPAHVRQVLRHAFSKRATKTSATEQLDPFAALRHANEFAAILCPSSLPSRLPIFDYNVSAALPGETLQYNFFEPRYLKLVEMATKRNAGGYFLLRMGKPPRGGAILLRIVQHAALPGGTIGVQCMAGPRVIIQSEESMAIEDEESKEGSDELPPLVIASEMEFGQDDLEVAMWFVDDEEHMHNVDKNEAFDKLTERRQREHILDLLSSVTDLEGAVGRIGLPPIEPTAFSFWALRFVLSESDVPSRQKWLFRCWHPFERIDHVKDLLETIYDQKKRAIEDK